MAMEVRVRKHRPRKKDNGHSIVESTTWPSDFGFNDRHAIKCQCGKVFKTKRDRSSLFYRHDAHVKEEES